MSVREQYDVAIVGASLAGCAAAISFGRQGARVALIERQADPQAYKTICGHAIQSSAAPTIERLGLWDDIEEAGGIPVSFEYWTSWGWIRPPVPTDRPPNCLSIRRQTLDPLLRRTAAAVDGVDLMAGETVDGVLRDGPQVTGVETTAVDGGRRTVHASLVVAADGRHSRVGKLAEVSPRVKRHGRFGYFTYYRDLPLKSRSTAQAWVLDPQWAAVLPTDDGLTLIAAMFTKDLLPDFKRDIEGNFADFVRRLPDGPDIDRGTRASKMLGRIESPNISRSPAPRSHPGLAFVGDAATTSDPLAGCGCGFALQSAEWLAEETAGALDDEAELQRALGRYRRRHRSQLRGHEYLTCNYATGRKLRFPERALFASLARDDVLADRFEAYWTRNVGPSHVLTPRTLARVGMVNARHRLQRVAGGTRT